MHIYTHMLAHMHITFLKKFEINSDSLAEVV